MHNKKRCHIQHIKLIIVTDNITDRLPWATTVMKDTVVQL